MTDPIPAAYPKVETIGGRIELLAMELELAIRWQRPCVLFAVYSSEYVRADAAALLENRLMDLGQEIFHVRVQGARDNLFPILSESETSPALVFFIQGLRWGSAEGQGVYTSLQKRRQDFKESGIRAVFWLTENEYIELARQAPDFWGLRSRAIEFVESPTPDQVMQQALEDAWQGSGEQAGQDEDTDAKISLQESLLTGIPAAGESGTLRANLLLTLGLLNWRKGAYEKADEQLQEALRIAARIEDHWFKAECFNGLALVRTSLHRMDEAIDAYKQAIRLAPEQIFAWNSLGNLCRKNGRNDEALVAFMKAVECNPRDPIAWNGVGSVYHDLGYFDDAIAAFRRSIRSMPSFAPPWSGLGDACASAGKIDDALRAYEKAIQLNGRWVTPWLHLAQLYVAQGRHRDAARAYQRALALDPRNASVWKDLGQVFIQSNAWQDAEIAFSTAVDLEPNDGLACNNLALAFARQGKVTRSIPLYMRSIDLIEEARGKAATWNRLGDAYRQINDYDKALAAYRMADTLGTGTSLQSSADGSTLSASPETVAGIEPASVIAPLPQPVDAAGAQPETEETLTDRVSAGSEEPSCAPETYLQEAPYWIFHQSTQPEDSSEPRQGDYQVAQGSMTSQGTGGTAMNAVENHASGNPGGETPSSQDPETVARQIVSGNENALAWNEKGNTHFKRGAFEDAINAYNKAIQLDPAFGWPYSNLALSYLSQGRPAEAILLYQKSIALLATDRERAVSWNGLGNAYRLMHDYAGALSAYQKAAELDPATAGIRDGAERTQSGLSPQNAQAWNDLGESLMKSGSYDQAAAAFRKALALDPALGWPYSNLARILASQGKHAQAIPLYKRSIELHTDKKDKAVSWNRLGNAYRKLNDYDNAIKAFQEAVALTDEGMNLVTRTRFSLLSNCYTE